MVTHHLSKNPQYPLSLKKTRTIHSPSDAEPPRQGVMASLRSLDLSGNGLSAHASAALGRNIRGTTSLVTLVLDANPLMGDGAASFASAIRDGVPLTSLSVVACGIGDEGCGALGRSIGAIPAFDPPPPPRVHHAGA